MMLIILILCFSTSTATSNGYYISNMTSIIFSNHSDQTTAYHNAYGMISSLAVDMDESVMFWSDVSPRYNGIYSASLSDLSVDTKLNLNPRPIKVLGLAIDPVHKNLYWTDEGQSTVEMYSYVSKMRRTLIFTDVSSPRGIALDLEKGLLYWNDQKLNHIEKSRLDGSERQVIVKNTKYPNHMVVHKGRLYWLNSDKKKLMTTNDIGSAIGEVAHFKELSSDEHVFGLTEDTAAKQFIVSTSSRRSFMFYVSTETFEIQMIQQNVGSNLYGLASDVEVPIITNACKGITLIKELCTTVESKPAIRCPSYGGVVLMGKRCTPPTIVLLFTILNHGYIAYINDPSLLQGKAQNHKDVHFVYKQQRPAALAYDSTRQTVYWSHLHPYAIYRCALNCIRPEVVMNRSAGLGLVEGMFFDQLSNILIFSDFGEVVKENGKVYGWNRIQLLDSRAKYVTTIFEAGRDAKLRAVAYDGRYVYYSDWGQSGRMGMVHVNGKNHKIIKSGFDNPNGFFYINSLIYLVDSHYKNELRNAELYEMSLDGSIIQTFSFGQKIPVGITLDKAYGNCTYISDWKNNKIFSVNFIPISQKRLLPNTNLATELVIDNAPSVFNLLSVQKYIRPNDTRTCTGGCGGVCVSGICQCPSLRLYGKSTSCQTLPSNFILFSDMTTIKMLNLESTFEPHQPATTLVYEDMYSTNILSLTYDPNSTSIYYFNQQEIRKINLYDSKPPSLVYRVKHHIESMTIYNNQLVWLDSLNGLLCRLSLLAKVRKHQVLLTGLTNPHTVRYYKGYIYWSESGVNSKLSRLAVNTEAPRTEVILEGTIGNSELKLNSFHVNSFSQTLIINNGGDDKIQIWECSLDGRTRRSVGINVGEISDLYAEKDTIIYSDLTDSSIKALKVADRQKIMLQQNLVRPGSLYIQDIGNTQKNCSKCKIGVCVPLVGDRFYCICPRNYLYSEEYTKCIDLNDRRYQCLYKVVLYNYLSTLELSACETCICKGQGIINHGDTDSLKGFECLKRICPELDCAVEKRIKDEQDCCERCPCEPMQLNTCPKTVKEIHLRPFGNYVIDCKHKPQAKFCPGFPKVTNISREPVNNIFQWKEGVSPADQLFSVTLKGYLDNSAVESDLCTYKVKLKDVTKPVLKCPPDVSVFSLKDEVEDVKWMPALANDNVGIKEMTSDPVWGSTFKVGITKVIYEVKDYSDLTSYCTFNVNIIRIPYVIESDDADELKIGNSQKVRGKRDTLNENASTLPSVISLPASDLSPTSEVRKCWIRTFLNGHLDCKIFKETNGNLGDTKELLRCEVVCYADYEINKDSPYTYACYNGTFEPTFPENMNTFQCQKKWHKTLTGILPLDLSNKCQERLDYEYTRKHLLYSIKNNMPSDILKYSVGTNGCKGNKRRRKRGIQDLTYNIGIGSETPQIQLTDNKNNLTNKLGDVSEYIGSDHILVVTISDSLGLQNNFDYLFQDIFFNYSCENGHIPDDDNMCIVCPGGYFQKSSVCSICPENTYNDREGSVECLNCPNQATSPKGSFNKLSCIPKPGVENWKLGLAVGIPVGLILLLLILLIIIVFCCFFKKRKHRTNIANAYPNGIYEDPSGMDDNGKAVKDEEEERGLQFLSKENKQSNGITKGPNGTVHSNSVFDSTY